MVDTMTPSNPITVARLVSTTQLNRAGIVGLSGKSFLDKFNSVIDRCRFEGQMNFLAGMKSDSRTAHLLA